MKIAILGPGAMGLLFGGYLSQSNEVTLVGRRPEVMEKIEAEGVLIRENDGTEKTYYPHATADAGGLGPMDLVIVQVKASATRRALEANRGLIGPGTLLLTLQNGAGHEALLRQFAGEEQIVIGTTQQGSYKFGDTAICHSGLGDTALGVICGEAGRLKPLAQQFCECGFPCRATEKVREMIWKKLMINASSSVLSGLLQVPQGYVEQNASAWAAACRLVEELCAVASAEGFLMDAEEEKARLRRHLQLAPDGYTSLYADLKAGRPTEVDVINGAVAEAGRRLGIAAPTHELMAELVHAMEERPR